MVVIDNCKVFVWELNPGQSIFGSKLQTHLAGVWTSVMTSPDVVLPTLDCKETAIDASWFIGLDQYGLSCTCSIVFNRDDSLLVTTLMLRWYDNCQIQDSTTPTFYVDWLTKEYPLVDIARQSQPINSHGAYVTRVSHDGHRTAVAVNQMMSHDNKIMFMSPTTGMVIVGDLRGCGARQETGAKYRYARIMRHRRIVHEPAR